MRFKGIVIALLVSLSILGSCAEEACPIAMKADYSLKKKAKVKFRSKRKPTPSLIHVTRVTYKRDKNFGY